MSGMELVPLGPSDGEELSGWVRSPGQLQGGHQGRTPTTVTGRKVPATGLFLTEVLEAIAARPC